MSNVDSLIETARKKATGRPTENVAITKQSLRVLVEEIEQLRKATSPLPDQNTIGKHHTNAKSTERAAALAVMPRTGTQRMKVLRAIESRPFGLTDPEISALTGIYLYSAAPRRCELVEGGWVKDSGITRATEHGKEATVWIITDKTKALLRTK